jgi:hypothetical protein
LDTTKSISEFFEHAINVLFAVVIGISFQISSQVVIPIEEIQKHVISAGILVLGYGIVISGWIGYYLSIKDHPHKGKLGYVRFVLDVLTLYLFYYIINLAKVENEQYRKDVFVYLLPIIYGVYIFWDIVKYFEHKKKNQTKEEKNDRIHRIRITVDYLVSFIIIAFIYYVTPSFEFKDIVFIIVSGILTFKYRYAKYVDSNKSRRRIPKRRSK